MEIFNSNEADLSQTFFDFTKFLKDYVALDVEIFRIYEKFTKEGIKSPKNWFAEDNVSVTYNFSFKYNAGTTSATFSNTSLSASFVGQSSDRGSFSATPFKDRGASTASSVFPGVSE